MKTIFTGLLIVASCGFIACTNQADDSSAEDPSDDVSLAASGNPDKNGLETFKVVNASILLNKTIVTSLVTHPLRKATNGTNGLTQNVLDAICDGTHVSLEAMRYITACALPKGTNIQHTCPGGNHALQTFYGNLGLATAWGNPGGVCAEGGCQEWVSACVLAHSSFVGEQGIDLQISGMHPSLNQGHDAAYLDDEAAYWGDIFNQNGTGQKRYGCKGSNAQLSYSSLIQGGTKHLLSRTCGYYEEKGSCDYCTGGTTSFVGNICNGGHSHYFQNLDSASAVRSCSTLCTTDTTANSGTYNSCTTNGSGTASSKIITVWRK